MIIYDREYYIYEKRDQIREYIIFTFLLSSLYSLITNYNKLNNISNPTYVESIFLAFFVTLSILILKNATDIKNYARKYNINLKKIKYLKSYDKLLFYVLLIISITNLLILFKNKNTSPIQHIKIFFNIFFLFIVIYYYSFLF